MKTQFLQRRLFLVLVLMVAFGQIQAQVDSAFAAQLQQILDHRVQFNGNHGVSACVIMPNGDTWKGTAGVGVNNVPITDSTVFHGASIAKANIATLIMLLAQDSLLSLDSSWHHYVSLNANFDTTITIRQLISHTSGIADYLEVPASEGYITTDFNHAFTPVELLETVVNDTPRFAPGTNFEYSTSNFVLAAWIVEAVTGHPVAEELRTRIWDPLGMRHTYFGGFESYSEPRAGVWWNFGSGLTNYSNDPETSMLTYGYGGANIVSTPEDLALFARALFTGGLVSPSSLSEMEVFSPQSYSSWCRGYGLGIHNADAFGNNSVLGHDGYYTNLSDMFHSYDNGFTLVTMSNTETQWVAIFNQMYNAIRNHLTVGAADPFDKRTFEILPNPAADGFSIDLGMPNENVHVEIFDLTGKSVLVVASDVAQNLELSAAALVQGMYIVRVTSSDFVATRRLVVAR